MRWYLYELKVSQSVSVMERERWIERQGKRERERESGREGENCIPVDR